MPLNLGFRFSNLSDLKKLDDYFLFLLATHNTNLYEELLFLRSIADKPQDALRYSNFLLNIASFFEQFIKELFAISDSNITSKASYDQFTIIYECKRKFIQRIAVKQYKKDDVNYAQFTYAKEQVQLTIPSHLRHGNCELLDNVIGIDNFTFARAVLYYLKNPEANSEILKHYAIFASYVVFHIEPHNILFTLPKIHNNSEDFKQADIDKFTDYCRKGFDYNDNEITFDNALNNAHYCIYCHKQGKDYCSKGLNSDKTGCPLKQKISEMNSVKTLGLNISALAIAMIDNPMIIATGYRICNDCSLACIYQKQEAVNIPLVETDILRNVLDLDYGVEIYILLSKWNPLKLQDYLPASANHYNVMIAGMGPAGFSLAYYLLHAGFNVVAIDGLKITNLPFNALQPIRKWQEFKSKLSEKIPQGFGGVMEYGITSRWDKNNLTIIRIMLERYSNFKLYGSTRLGSNLTSKQLINMGCDHIALCLGAGHPVVPSIPNLLVQGVRTANDFLLCLNSQGAFLPNSNIGVMLRMPIAVLGGGLTAIDAAVEAVHYYISQVERFYKNYNKLLARYGIEYLENCFSAQEQEIIKELISHAELFSFCSSYKDKLQIIKSIGGVTIYYRQDITKSPAYKTNAQEITHAMALGIRFVSNAQLNKIHTDHFNCLQSIEYLITSNDEEKAHISYNTPTKTLLLATGLGKYLTGDIAYNEEQFSSFGDYNFKVPRGSVVNAVASAKYGYSGIMEKINKNSLSPQITFEQLTNQLNELLLAKIITVEKLSDDILLIKLYAPYAASNYQAGQFFKLQNYTLKYEEQTEPIAVTATDIDSKQNQLTLLLHIKGYSTKLCESLKPQEQVSLMGPIGTPIKIESSTRVMLITYDINNFTSYYLAKYIKQSACHLIHLAIYEYISPINFYSTIDISDELLTIKAQRLEEQFKDIITNTSSPIDRIIVMASPNITSRLIMLKNKYLSNKVKFSYHLHQSMQCMMSGICGRCIIMDNNSNTFFSCLCKENDNENLNFQQISARLHQNSLLDKISAMLNNSVNN